MMKIHCRTSQRIRKKYFIPYQRIAIDSLNEMMVNIPLHILTVYVCRCVCMCVHTDGKKDEKMN